MSSHRSLLFAFVLLALSLLFALIPLVGSQTIRLEGEEAPRDNWGSCPLDSHFKNPLKVRKKLPFCSHYTERACCDAEDTLEIKKTVDSIITPQCPNCYLMISEWKCAECHPNAGLFYVGEQSSIRFCEDYCTAVFEVCKDIPLGIEQGAFYINEPSDMTAEEWCESKVGPEGKCFGGTIPNAMDQSCKCEDHKCHLEIMEKLLKEDKEL